MNNKTIILLLLAALIIGAAALNTGTASYITQKQFLLKWDVIQQNNLTTNTPYTVLIGPWTNIYAADAVSRRAFESVNGSILFSFYSPDTNQKTLGLAMYAGSQNGILSISINDVNQTAIDFYNSIDTPNYITSTIITPSAGFNILNLTVTGKNPSSGNYIIHPQAVWITDP